MQDNTLIKYNWKKYYLSQIKKLQNTKIMTKYKKIKFTLALWRKMTILILMYGIK